MVLISDYTVVRFQMRADCPEADEDTVRRAWKESTIVYEGDNDYQERYHKDYSVVMIRKDGVLKTVLREENSAKERRGDLCVWCGKDTLFLKSCQKCNGVMLTDEPEY